MLVPFALARKVFTSGRLRPEYGLLVGEVLWVRSYMLAI
jgi:hypothetical protein